jgi:hypothetical protein
MRKKLCYSLHYYPEVRTMMTVLLLLLLLLLLL